MVVRYLPVMAFAWLPDTEGDNDLDIDLDIDTEGDTDGDTDGDIDPDTFDAADTNVWTVFLDDSDGVLLRE
jgi:hypothetical protein